MNLKALVLVLLVAGVCYAGISVSSMTVSRDSFRPGDPGVATLTVTNPSGADRVSAVTMTVNSPPEIIITSAPSLSDREARAFVARDRLLTALANLDAVIQTIRESPDADVAKQRLMDRFHLSELQSQAILDMQLRRLAALERKKIEQEYKEVTELIKELEALLHSAKKMRQALKDELRDING